MRLKSAIPIVVAAMIASPAAAGSSSVTMGVGLTVVVECRVASCGAAPRPAERPRANSPVRATNAPRYLTTRSATAASPGNVTTTY